MHIKNEFNQSIGFPLNNWNPPIKPPKTNMQGTYCILEALDPEKHGKALFESIIHDNQGESWTYLPYGPFYQYEDFYRWLVKMSAEQSTVFYAILDAKSRRPIGMSSYLRITPEYGTIEIGHLHFSKLLKRTPAATEAIYLMMARVFDELGYRRCEWKCDSLNQPSRDAALRFGFKFEGIFRQDRVVKNRNRDTAWFSIIDGEWPTLKIRFQKWLSETNFDMNGNQKLRLKEII